MIHHHSNLKLFLYACITHRIHIIECFTPQATLAFWGSFNMINLWLMPPRFHLLFSSVASVGWNTYLSFLTHRLSKDPRLDPRLDHVAPKLDARAQSRRRRGARRYPEHPLGAGATSLGRGTGVRGGGAIGEGALDDPRWRQGTGAGIRRGADRVVGKGRAPAEDTRLASNATGWHHNASHLHLNLFN